jgi:hypothetical protein
MLYRVFGRSDAFVGAGTLLEHLTAAGFRVSGHFRGDDLGWTAGEIVFPDFPDTTPLYTERWLPAEDDIRDELNAWAAWLETADYSTHHTVLMERVIQTRQLFVFRKPLDHPNEPQLDAVCTAACKFLAAATEGVYQADGQGFYAADGELLLMEY